MRLLWVTRASKADGGTIYDGKMRKAVAGSCEITPLVAPALHAKWAQLPAMARFLVPHDRSRYVSLETVRQVQAAEKDADAVVLSHESIDWLAPHLTKPTVLLLHNVTSSYAGHLSRIPGSGQVLSQAYRLYERRIYAKRPGLAVTCLSVGDTRVLESLTQAPLFMAQPGMPPVVLLAQDALVGDRIVISGTYDWSLKKRGLLRFAEEYDAGKHRFSPMFDEPPPPEAAALIPDWRPSTRIPAQSLDFGLITDRFEAGFKLKVGSYIADNMAVLSYADVSADYEGLPHAEDFIRRVRSIDDIQAAIAQIRGAAPAEVLAKFRLFQAAAAERFSWARAGESLVDALRSAAG